MVLYHADGRVVIAHENYLEQEARKQAGRYRYEEQIDVCNGVHAPKASSKNVDIVIDNQFFKTLYCDGHAERLKNSCWEWLPKVNKRTSEERISVSRRALVAGSTLAEKYFRFKPGSTELHLPVEWPRKHVAGENRSMADFNEHYNSGGVVVPGKRYTKIADSQMAYIRSDEIKTFIVPWLNRVEMLLNMGKDKRKQGHSQTAHAREKELMDLTKEYTLRIDPPETLIGKIHLYNAMLQLGLPRFVQQPIIDALVLQMYQKPLQSCHLSILEATIGRFHSRSMAVLDPVICHLVGTYAFRTLEDRNTPDNDSNVEAPAQKPSQPRNVQHSRPAHVAENGRTAFHKTGRQVLTYINYNARRAGFPDDTFILPPRLPVLGHSIAHWSDVRGNGSTAAAHMGFPLNIGQAVQYQRIVRPDASVETVLLRSQTNRLSHQPYYHAHMPGLASDDAAGPSGQDSPPPSSPITATAHDETSDSERDADAATGGKRKLPAGFDSTNAGLPIKKRNLRPR